MLTKSPKDCVKFKLHFFLIIQGLKGCLTKPNLPMRTFTSSRISFFLVSMKQCYFLKNICNYLDTKFSYTRLSWHQVLLYKIILTSSSLIQKQKKNHSTNDKLDNAQINANCKEFDSISTNVLYIIMQFNFTHLISDLWSWRKGDCRLFVIHVSVSETDL